MDERLFNLYLFLKNDALVLGSVPLQAMAPLSLCYASAGAGKTHALVHNYLCQTLKNPQEVRRTLAITFTNAATQEMKSRLIGMLYALGKGVENEVATVLQKDLACDQKTLRARASELLTHILHRYQDFSVTTIDALFQKIVRTFAHELGLAPNYNLLLDFRPFLDEAMLQLWETLSHYPSLENSLITLSLHRMQQGKNWDPSSHLTALAQHALSEYFGESSKDKKQTLAGLDSFFKKRSQEAREIKARLAKSAQGLLDKIETSGFEVDAFAYGQRGIIGFLQKIAQYKEASPGVRIRKMAYDATLWGGKGNVQLTAFAEKDLQGPLQSLLKFYDETKTDYCTIRALQPLYYALAANTQLGKILVTRYQLEDLMPIATIPNFLKKVLDHTPASFLYQKLGTSYHHLLIDEFQDVSNTQWDSLRTLLADVLSQQGEGFLVGDVKQAIYRWRGGNAQLFLSQVAQDFSGVPLQKKALPYNWRSLPGIIHFNNQLFLSASRLITKTLQEAVRNGSLAEDLQASFLKKIALIKEAYAHTTQQLPPTKNVATGRVGYVEVAFFPKKNRDSTNYHWKKAALSHTIQQVEELQQLGYEPGKIAMLVRNHQEASMIAEAFSEYKKSEQAKSHIVYEVAANSKVFLGDNPYIKLLLNALQYIQDPQAGWRLTLLIHLYQTYVKQGDGQVVANAFSHSYWQAGKSMETAVPYLPKGFLEEVPAYANLPLSCLVQRLVEVFDLNQEMALPYLHNFQEIVYAFACDGGHLGGFLAWWDKGGSQTLLPRTPEKNCISINTIHQVKGLAFDVVLVPFCAWSMDHSPQYPPILSCHTSKAPFDTLAEGLLYYGKHLKETHYVADYYHEQWQAYLDNLNLLYVACTRAREHLYLFGPSPAVSGKLATVGDLLEASLLEASPTLEGLICQPDKEKGCNVFYYGRKEHKVSEKLAEKPSPLYKEEVLRPHTLHHEKLLKNLSAGKKIQGLWWHALLAQVETKEEIEPLVLDYVKASLVSEEEAADILAKIATWWKHEKMRDWFGGGWEIKREKAILLADGTSLRPDRVMIRGDHAVVLDFKTSVPKAVHSEQVAIYASLLRTMGYRSVESYLFYTATNQLVAVA